MVLRGRDSDGAGASSELRRRRDVTSITSHRLETNARYAPRAF